MSSASIEKLKSVKDFDALVAYLRDELEWPIEVEKAEDITFDYNPRELGIESKHAAKIKKVKQIRPLTDSQPWGIFYVEFEPKKLPIVVLRRILRALIHSRRQIDDRLKTWDLSDLIFISSLGETADRTISFAHFSEVEKGLPELRTFSWDARDTYFHYLQNTLDLDKLRWPANENDADAWRDQWSSAFTRTHRYVIRTSQQLAVEMARLAAQIRDQVKIVYEYEVASGPLHKLFENFKKMLIYDLEIDTFADMYAQTIAYGLFSAKATHEGEFAIEDIPAMIPNTNPFLKNLFEECTRIGDTHRECLDLDELGVTELVRMLKEIEIEPILQDFGKLKRIEDPVIHFYEDFLREYDPKQKVKRGIFYTPDPVVSFIVRSVDYLLRTEFNCPDGLADTSTIPVTVKETKVNGEVTEEVRQVPKVQILDPAVGTGTFLKYVIEEIKKTFDQKHKDLSENELREEWNVYVDKHLLPRVFGFELLMAPYAIAHLKLGLKLKETGYEFLSNQRLGVALTNSLESGKESAEKLDPYLGWLAQESIYANYIKTSKNISVIIGNPPYLVSSENKSEFIKRLMEDYKQDVKDEKQRGALEDDYIKFIKFAHWKLDQTAKGIFGFITNNTYLFGMVHRGMRKRLLESFNKIYILNLHGSSKVDKKPTIILDENVFDIQQGVAIAIYVKLEKQPKEKKVYYADLWGQREEIKYPYLSENDVESVNWQELKPQEPYYFFEPRDLTSEEEYNKFLKVTEIFKEKTAGIVTGRDLELIGFSSQEIVKVFKDVFNPEVKLEDLELRYNIKETSGWNIQARREALFKNGETFLDNKIASYAHRPFSREYTYYCNFLERPQRKVMEHLLQENIALVTTRLLSSVSYQHIFVSKDIGDKCFISSKTRETNYYFPLYLYPAKDKQDKITNFTFDFQRAMEDLLNTVPTPEDIFHYIYAVLYSPSYRERYEVFLKTDFPRVPLTSSFDLFKALSRFGSELVSLHLMKSPKLDHLITEFKGDGDNVVGVIGKNSYKDGKLKINKTQYFEGIPEDVYKFYIGGYQVCEKWLKDRKDRKLTEEEIEHYQKIVVAINETIKIMREIDRVIEEHGGWPIR
jgi:type I restriction-modification system DNA methylase subunit